jgi:predicted nuclease of predicted toxin-antitoxin system
MRFVVDENVSYSLVEVLRASGYQVIEIQLKLEKE